MTKKQRKWLIRIIISGVLFIILFVLEHIGMLDALKLYIRLPVFLIPYLIIGYDVILKAAKNIAHGKIFDENFLMMIATFGAFVVNEYLEAVAVMLFYQVGELFQNYAVGKSRESIKSMMEIVPEYANVEENGSLIQVDPDDVEIGTVITILPGERVPLDGTVIEGSSYVDTAALTGESVPRSVDPGDTIISGCVNSQGTLKVRTTKEFEDSTVAKILELVENASSKKARTENFITRFAKYYTPVVTLCAVLLALLPPIIAGGGFGMWLERACIFLVISCPCALVISVPLGFFGGIGAASRIGVLVKGSNYLELAADLGTVVFDKTGTLTLGEFKVTEIIPAGRPAYRSKSSTINTEKASDDSFGEPDEFVLELLRIAAHAEGYSNHPIAVSIREAFEEEFHFTIDRDLIKDAKEIAGQGICAVMDSGSILAGNDKLMRANDIEFDPCDSVGTVVYLADQSEKKYLGCIVISDSVKEGIRDDIALLHSSGVDRTVMLTGDARTIAERVAENIGIDMVEAELLPQDKVSFVEGLLDKTGKRKLAFVGDGINDAPVLMRADVGIAMGSMGSDAAIEAADIVIMDDDIKKISKIIRIAKKTMRIVKENIVFALGVKFAILILGALGIANMWLAVFADVGVAVIAILNAMRMLGRRN
ncbi:MAG TPA: heavy metal translocating P-type ATPase [Lachnospiraceae bacterium]|nr:heavy metal translocating P-type ATPase [Lachnospiraceae bacterium]